MAGEKNNPRWKGGKRRKYRARFKALGLPCHLCGQPIHYDEPSDPHHPLSFVIEGGYESPEGAALDWNNLAPAHYICNQKKSNRLPTDKVRAEKVVCLPDGKW